LRVRSHFKSERLAKNLSLGDLARLVGYKNVAKGANRIIRFEREGVITDELLIKLAKALDIDWATVEALAQQDRKEHVEAWTEWADEPVPMKLVLRLIAAVYSTCQLPEEITTPEKAERYACDVARMRRMQVCLVLNRRKSVWIDADGTVLRRTEATPFGGSNEPWMQLKGRRFLLNCKTES